MALMCPRHWQAQDDQVIGRQQEVDARLCDLADCPIVFLPGSRFSASVTCRSLVAVYQNWEIFNSWLIFWTAVSHCDQERKFKGWQMKHLE